MVTLHRYPPQIDPVTYNAQQSLIETWLNSGSAPANFVYPFEYIIKMNGADCEAYSSTGLLIYGGASDVGGIDGGNASAVIQEVVDAASNGDTIIFKKGAYVLPTKITIQDKVLHLVGESGARNHRDNCVAFSSTTITDDYFFEVKAVAANIIGGSIRNIGIYNAGFAARNQYGILLQSITNAVTPWKLYAFTIENITNSYLTRVITLDGYIWQTNIDNIHTYCWNGTFAGEYVLSLEKSTDTLAIYYAPKWCFATNIEAEGASLGDSYDYIIRVYHPRATYNVFHKITTWGFLSDICCFYDCGVSNHYDTIHTQDINLGGDPLTFEAIFIIEKKDAPEAGFGTEARYGGFGNIIRGMLASHENVIKYTGSPFQNDIEIEQTLSSDMNILGTAGVNNHVHISHGSHSGINTGCDVSWSVVNTAGVKVTGLRCEEASIIVPFVGASGGSGGLGDRGFDLDANNEIAHTFITVPSDATRLVSIKFWAMSNVTETHAMNAGLFVYGGASNENYLVGSSVGAFDDNASITTNFTADDIIYWEIPFANVGTPVSGDCYDIRLVGRAASGDNCATDCAARCVEVVYWKK